MIRERNVNKRLRRPGASPPISLNPEEMHEVCSVLEGEFDDPDEVFMDFMVRLPGRVRSEFENVDRIFGELTRSHAPLLDVVRECRVGIYDEQRSLEIDYPRLWLFNGFRIRADAEVKWWWGRATGAAAGVLESRETRPLRIVCFVYVEGMLRLAFQASAGRHWCICGISAGGREASLG